MTVAAATAPAPVRDPEDGGPWVQLKEVAGEVVVDLATCVAHAETYYLVEIGHDGACYLPSTEGLPKRHYRIIPGARYILARKSETNMRRSLPKRTLRDTATVAAQLQKQRTSVVEDSVAVAATSTAGSSWSAALGDDRGTERKRGDETAPTSFPLQRHPQHGAVAGKLPSLPEDLDDRPITLVPTSSAPPARSMPTRAVLGASENAYHADRDGGGAVVQSSWGAVSRSPSAFAAPALSTSAAAFARADPSESAAGVHRRRSYLGDSISAVNVHSTHSPSPNPFRASEAPTATAARPQERETQSRAVVAAARQDAPPMGDGANESRRERKKRHRGDTQAGETQMTTSADAAAAAVLHDDGVVSETQLTQRTLSADTLSPLFAPSQPFPQARRSGSLAAAAESASRSMHARRI